MARRVGAEIPHPPQVIWPRDAGRSPIADRSRVVFPEPLGPIRTVGAPAENAIEIPSSNATPPARIPTSEKRIGKSEVSTRTFSPRSAQRRDAAQGSALIIMTIKIKTLRRPIASGKFPLDVSSAIVVVIVRVNP